MHAKHSIARLILGIIVLMTLMMAGVMTVVNVVVASRKAYSAAQEQAYDVARSMARTLSGYSLKEIREEEVLQQIIYRDMKSFVEEEDLLFVYIVIPDVENNTLDYCYIEGAEDVQDIVSDFRNDEIQERSKLSDEIVRVMNGESAREDYRLNNEYGNVITSYVPIYGDTFQVVAVAGADVSVSEVMKELLADLSVRLWWIIIIGLVNAVVLFYVMKKRVIEPARSISEAMTSFGQEDRYEVPQLNIKRQDEFGLISADFIQMAEKICSSIDRIREYTKLQSRHKYELNVASEIQQGFLPAHRYEDELAEINACMLPAKNVGGDFYDYFEDHGHMVLVVADVSGKGLSGAIFMAGAISLVRGFVKEGLEPHEVLRAVNRELEHTNPNMMFVTLFLVYYEKETGRIRYSNAGHNPPYIVCDGRLKTLTDAGGVPLGVFGEENYETAEEMLPLGATLFLYTDGVNEALDGEGTFFGIERLERVLREDHGGNTIEAVRKELREFMAGSEQADDITMITFTSRSEKLRLPAKTPCFGQLRDWVLEETKVPENIRKKLCLMAEEVFINIASYAYDDGPKDAAGDAQEGIVDAKKSENLEETLQKDPECISGKVLIRRQIQEDRCLLQFTDTGKPFDQSDNIIDIEEYDPMEQIGGLGRFMVDSLADEWQYIHLGDENVLMLCSCFSKGDSVNRE